VIEPSAGIKLSGVIDPQRAASEPVCLPPESDHKQVFPRTLFVTPCAFNPVTGTGVTFSNLFRDWPKERLATVTHDSVDLSTDVCNQYYYLTCNEIIPIAPFRWLGRFFLNSRRKIQKNPLDSPNVSGKPIYNRLTKYLANKVIRPCLGEAGIPNRGVLTEELKSYVRDFKPDVLFTILGLIPYIDLVNQLQETFNLPVVVHLMDDGVTVPYYHGLYGGYIRRNYTRLFENLLPRTAVRLGICPTMAQTYQKRYRLTFSDCQNTIDVAHCSSVAMGRTEVGRPPRLIYVGSILETSQYQSLIDICEVVKNINEHGKQLRFDIYASHRLFGQLRSTLEIHPMIRFHDAPTDDLTFFKLIGNADILALPVNFDARSRRFIRLSMPTKVPTYLASGRPILVFGPSGTAQVDYAKKEKWGYVVDQRDFDQLKHAIIHLLEDPSLRQRLHDKAIQVASQNHDIDLVRTQFREHLRRGANHHTQV